MDFNKYKNTDYIAHYTGLEACLSILDSKELWLTPKRNTTDLFEHMLASKMSVGVHSERRASLDPLYMDGPLKASQIIAETYKCIRQSSFCKTDVPVKIGCSEHMDIDGCCFMRQRMWEQYASNYEGVCLIFSLTALEAGNPHIQFEDARYVSISHLNQIVRQDALDADRFHEDSGYMAEARQAAISRSLFKALDYQDEKEIRALFVVNDEKTDHVGLSIECALKAIALFPEYALSNKSETQTLSRRVLEMAEMMGIEVLLLDASNGLSVVTLQDHRERIKEIHIALEEARKIVKSK